ncbi:MAG: glycosyltransferase family 2 protein [Bacteroidia bacterium]|nr:glycosyltransferase family 2 protein [Bacteroidia bacterium]
MRIGIVIPTYNNLPELRLCLAALKQQTYTDFTAYVCVDGSTDGTWEYLQQVQLPFLRALTHPDGRNRGRNAARNLILPYLSNHEWLVFLDSDSLPLPDWLESFIRANPTPNEALLGQIIYYAEDNPNPWAEYLRWREKVRAQREPRSPHFITINLLIPARAFLQVGGMDEKIRRHGLGDVELGYRLMQAGLRFRYVAEARVWSHVQQTPAVAVKRLYDMAQHNLAYLHQKHPLSKAELFGGEWLYHPTRRFILRMILRPWIAQRIFRWLHRWPASLRRWGMRYLVLYAVARGFWKRKLGLPLSQRERPSP